MRKWTKINRIEEILVSNSSLVSGLSEASGVRLSWVEVSQKVWIFEKQNRKKQGTSRLGTPPGTQEATGEGLDSCKDSESSCQYGVGSGRYGRLGGDYDYYGMEGMEG